MSTRDFTPGWWINQGKGPLMALTLTVSMRDGGLLISFLTILVRLVGSHMWGICRFVLHQYRISRDAHDGLYHQQQATLRNASQLGSALWKFATLAWVWRSNTKRPLRRSMPLLGLVAFQLIAFTIAGLFTSRIIASSNETLYPMGFCGYWQSLTALSYDEYNAATVNARGIMESSKSYVQDCYGRLEGVQGPECNHYVRQQIESMVNTELPCPFADPTTCVDQNYNIRMDTGYVDSNKDLGINAPPEHSIFYRKTTTCAVVNSTNWLSGHISSEWATNYVKGPADVLPGDTSIYYHFGHGFDYQEEESDLDYIFHVSNYSRLYTTEAYSIQVAESVLGSPGQGGGSAFLPSSTFFTQTDQDLQLIFLVNRASYTSNVSDIWYSANYKIDSTTGLGNNYISDYPASVMACFEQHQICSEQPSGLNDNEPSCTALTGRSVLKTSMLKDKGDSISLNRWQWATANRLLQNIDETTIGKVLLELGPSVLHAQAYLDWQTEDFTSNPVVDDEWMIEVGNWHNITLANLQEYSVDYAAGPWYSPLDRYVLIPNTTEELVMCANQRIRSSQALSFNGFGVIAILVVGSVIVATNLCLPTAVGFIQRHIRGAYRHQEWVLDETLQLQRVAYQRAGQGIWRNADHKVPLCERDEKFRHSRYFDDIGYPPPPSTPGFSPYSPYMTEITEFIPLKR